MDTEKPWYCRSCVGVNTLNSILPDLSKDTGLDVCYTNHSLLVTAVTWMFGRGVPEKIIAQKSGHKSLKALHAYKRTSSTQAQEKAAGECIQSGRPFEEAHGSVYSEEGKLSVAVPMALSQKTPGAPEDFRRWCSNFLRFTTAHSTSTALNLDLLGLCSTCMHA